MKVKDILEARYAQKPVKIKVNDKTGGLYLIEGNLYSIDAFYEEFQVSDEDDYGTIDLETAYGDFWIMNAGDTADLILMNDGWAAINVYDDDGHSYDGPMSQREGTHPYFIIPQKAFEEAVSAKWISRET